MIKTKKQDGILTVTLDRADKANSLTASMLADLRDVAREAATDAELVAVVLTGAGDKVFSAGADLEAAKAGLAKSFVWEEVSAAIAAIPCMTIAALNGTLAGGAFGMALACDVRFAVPHANFFYPVAKLGHNPQPSDPARLKGLIGAGRSKLMLVGGERITAQTALEWGLIEGIAEDVLGHVGALCERLVVCDPIHLRRIKSML